MCFAQYCDVKSCSYNLNVPLGITSYSVSFATLELNNVLLIGCELTYNYNTFLPPSQGDDNDVLSGRWIPGGHATSNK